MTFAEKLQHLTEGKSRAALARTAGLSIAAISNYINGGHTPRLDAALAIARAAGVELDWLSDDRQSIDDLPHAQLPKPPAVALPTLDDCGRALLRRLADQLNGPRLLDAISAASDALSRQIDPPVEVAYSTAEASSPSEGGAA